MIDLKTKLVSLPRNPGVYMFKDRRGEVLYVGKAKNLQNRIRSYFAKRQNHLPRTHLMLAEVAGVDYIIVSSELESLILENNLIKEYRPRFNVRLKDDKNYQFIKIDYDAQIPQIYAVRKIEKTSRGKSKYFGPYTSTLSVRETLKLLRKIFPLCGNKKISGKPCFYYHLGRCPGVCIGKISLLQYREALKGVEDFLNHRQTQIVSELKTQMRAAARNHQFEKAALLRDKIRALGLIWEKQKIVSPRRLSEDYFSLFLASKLAIVNLFVVREGRLTHQETFELDYPPKASLAQILGEFLKQYYGEAANHPQTIVCKYELPEKSLLEKWLKLKIVSAKRGKKLQLLNLGETNAQDYYRKKIVSNEKILADLKEILKLPTAPLRIEAYDISNIQGFLPVGSMVVFEEGLPKKSDYRKFKINLKQTPDDVAMMREMLQRRFAHFTLTPNPSPVRGEGSRRPGEDWPLPDLIIVDGGRGQLNAALEVVQIPMMGLAKRLEEIYLPNNKKPVRLPDDSPVLHLLQRIRDEAHHFAITFYRGRHRKEGTRSELDEIPGLGPIAKKKLLMKFGSNSGIRAASLEVLAQEIGPTLAKKIKELL